MPRVDMRRDFVSVPREEWEELKRRDEDYRDLLRSNKNLHRTVEELNKDIAVLDAFCDWVEQAYPNAYAEFAALKKVKGE